MKGRPITDRRSGDLGLGPRVTHGQARYETSNQDSQTQANARASSDIPAGQFYGPAAKEDAISNGNPSPLPMNERNSRERERDSPLDIPIRERLRPNGEVGGKKTNGTARACTKCGQYLTGQYVRALEGTFHLECFICHDCGDVVASKFFPLENPNGIGQIPFCERDYYRRQNLLCFECGGALRNSYITALERKYHIEHFTCSVCPTIFGAQDSYYEHEGNIYCHFHYSTQFAQRCTGCKTAILKQFVEIFRDGHNQHWHPECYMIHKYWNVHLSSSSSDNIITPLLQQSASEDQRALVREEEEQMEEKVYRIWSVLSAFEESSASCISDMLLHVSNGAYVDGVLVAKRFIGHVEILFTATDSLNSLITVRHAKGLVNGREAKILCKKIVSFFKLLSKTQETGVRKLGVTQELLSLVTGLAHYLKLLIRISLQGALKLEQEERSADGLHRFLEDLSNLDSVRESDTSLDLSTELVNNQVELCQECKETIEDECVKTSQRRWHTKHLQCNYCQKYLGEDWKNALWSENKGQAICRACNEESYRIPDAIACFSMVTHLQQLVYLLRVALARLLCVLRSGGTLPHTSGNDPNLSRYDSNEGHRINQEGQLEPPLLRSASRSKSYDASTALVNNSSTYEQTVGEMKRLRSKRMDTQLSSTTKKARTSRVIDGPEGRSARPGSAHANDADLQNQNFQIIEDRDATTAATTELTFGNQDALTLDDIPRIVAAEQAKEQRPNAYKHAQQKLLGGSGIRQPKLLFGHQRNVSSGNPLDRHAFSDLPPSRTKKYFSELTALEYFIVRHVAVLSMEPLLQGHYNLEELLGLIETSKPTFWGKLGKAFKNDRPKGTKKRGVFGVSLDILVERDAVESTHGVGPGVLRVPGIIDDVISAMRRMDMSVEGVFRKNGNIRGLRDLADKLDAKEVEVDLTKENPVQLAALLKKFLRELPDPLLTYKLYRLFITSQKIPDEVKRRRVLHLTCCLLPKSHRDSLEILFSFLGWASSFSEIDDESGSKMDTHNLATVITPNVLKEKTEKAGMDESSFLAIEAINSLIEYNEYMCEVPEDLQSILNDTSLFNNTSEITTKEILKRYGDRTGQQPTITQPESTSISGTHVKDMKGSSSISNGSAVAPRSAAPVITHITSTDPHHAHTWPKESSVRHIQGPDTPLILPSGVAHDDLASSQEQFVFVEPPSPYAFHQRTSSADSQRSRAGEGEKAESERVRLG